MQFTGFPTAALDFYEDLEVDNAKSFWDAHKATYAEAVREPMLALCAGLAEEFGEAKVFRPYRDVRFARDKTPYKTHQGGYVAVGPATGWYVEISARGVRTGGGFYDAESARLAAFREAVADDARGPLLEDLLDTLAAAGWEVGGDRLKTSPRGFPADHPRIGLLRHRSLSVVRAHGFAPYIHTPELLVVVRADWRALPPLVAWIDDALRG